jgi:hypothetical protein
MIMLHYFKIRYFLELYRVQVYVQNSEVGSENGRCGELTQDLVTD